MNYFMSDIHGAYQAYLKLKHDVGFSNNDELYIIGDALDGNDSYPEQCFYILDDAIEHDNIHFLLGNHEFAHLQYFLCMQDGDKMALKSWENYLKDPACRGEALLKYIYNGGLTWLEQKRYFDFLAKCKAYDFVCISDILVFLVHGAPTLFQDNGKMEEWYADMVMYTLDLSNTYREEVLSVPDIPPGYADKPIWTISGHLPTKYYYQDRPELIRESCFENGKQKQRIICSNHHIILDCGCRANSLGKSYKNGWASTLACIGIGNGKIFEWYADSNTI